MTSSKSKKTKLGQGLIKATKELLPDSSTIGVEELVPVIKHTQNPETLRRHNDDLVAANVALNEFNNKLMLQLADKDKQITHLQDLLVSGSGVPLIGGEGLVSASPELQLIEVQLKKLQATALTRELTLDEVKRFDLYIKNKNLINQAPTEIPGRAKQPAKQLTKEQLVQVAAKKTSQENS